MTAETATIIIAGVAAGASILSLIANFFIIARQQRHIERREFNNWLRDKQLEAFVNGVDSLAIILDHMRLRWIDMLKEAEKRDDLKSEVLGETLNIMRARTQIWATFSGTRFSDSFEEHVKKTLMRLAALMKYLIDGEIEAAAKSLIELQDVIQGLGDLAEKFHDEIQP